MKYKHIIWDYNGTLLDDVELCTEIINEMLAKRNLPTMSIEKYRELFDFPVKEYYKRAGFNFEKESFEKTGTEFIEQYDKRSYKTKLYDGIFELIQKISESGIRQSILSARKKEQLHEELKKFEIFKFFDYVFGLNDHYAGGKTETGKQLLKKINLPRKKILMIGDTVHDCETAKILGIDILPVAYGHHPKQKLLNYKTYIPENVKEIRDFIFDNIVI
ncbi:MAG: HAD family hydrolase [Chlorobi bacterium]|nr:HAD family hydrolase [Chlorobiota bacterium]